jgi:hypothetical protein
MASTILAAHFKAASLRDMKILGLLLGGYIAEMYHDGRHIPDMERHEHEVLYVILNGSEGVGKSAIAEWIAHMIFEQRYESIHAKSGHANPKKVWENKLSLNGQWQNRIYDAVLEYSVFKHENSKDIENAIVPARTRPGIEIIENLPLDATSAFAKEIMEKAVTITIKKPEPENEGREIMFTIFDPSAREAEVYKELKEGAQEFNLM